MGKDDKTNVCRLLEQKKINYQLHYYSKAGTANGVETARILGENPNQVFKTLVTIAPKTKNHYVFVVPVAEELNLKKAAKIVGEKSIEMIKQKELLPLTGYIHGGCSPIGMKKFFQTTIHETAADFDTIFFSAGKVGYQVEVAPEDLSKIIKFKYGDIISD